MPGNRITRRHVLAGAFCGAHLSDASDSLIEVPVLRVLNRHMECSATEVRQFAAKVWDEAARTFRSCGVCLRTIDRQGEIHYYPSGLPRFSSLERGMLNVVLTDRIPLVWDNGRSLAGVATVHEGYHVSVIAMKRAYPNRVPVIAVNTVVHEMLHVFCGDIFQRRTSLIHEYHREALVDWLATRLWLLERGTDIRRSAEMYVLRLASG